MKKCTRCGALQDDGRTICLDCGEHLPPPLNEEETAKAEAELDKRINSLSDRADNFYVNRLDKAFIVFDIAGIIATIVITIIIRERTMLPLVGGIAAITFILSALGLIFPEKVWNLQRRGLSSIINEWEDVSPSFGRIWGNKIIFYMFTGLGLYSPYYMFAG